MIWILWGIIAALLVSAAFIGMALTAGEARREDSADCGAPEGEGRKWWVE